MEPLISHQINHTKPKIIINGETYIARDRLEVEDKEILRLIFESKNSDRNQSICIVSDQKIELEKNKEEKARAWAFWWDGPMRYIDVICRTKKNEVAIYNGWIDDRGFSASALGGAAMRIEDLPDGSRRYYCNDGDLDNDFDDFVFRVVRLNGKPIKSLHDDIK